MNLESKKHWIVSLLLAFPVGVFAQPHLPDMSQRADPQGPTIQANQAIEASPLFADEQDFLDAQRGLMARLDPLVVRLDNEANDGTCRRGCEGPDFEESGNCATVIWNLEKYAFLNPYLCTMEPEDSPKTWADFPKDDTYAVNPSLWRNAVLNTIHGVFEVGPDKVFQVRGYDLSNMSAIRGNTGWIIIDPLTTAETAREALANLNRAYGTELPVSAIIFTHSHVDHFGGIEGLNAPASALVYAPEGFLEEAVSENVTVGNAMGRRATYMYGPLLRRGPQGQVDGGLGKSTPSGTTGIAEPDCIVSTGKLTAVDGAPCPAWSTGGSDDELAVVTIDGRQVQFQNVPGSEAPAEMLFYFSDPDLKALCASEDVTHTFHNVLTLRGANVRDSLLWAKYLHKTLSYFSDAEVVFASHHWPTWGETQVREIIEKQRDLYRYIHDQSVRLTNKGHTIQEVGELVKLPPSLGENWYNRGYYGTVNHNAKAVYQRYIGWFDGNPASLHQLPPNEASFKYVQYMGEVSSILPKAKADYEAGNYRWVAMVLNHVIRGTPTTKKAKRGAARDKSPLEEARALLADTYDQLGYQAESGPWRNFYLTGAMELRNGVLPLPAVKTFTRDTVEAMDLEMVFDFIAVHLDGLEAGALDHVFNLQILKDLGATQEASVLYLKNGVLNYDVGSTSSKQTATLTLSRDQLNDIVMGLDDEEFEVQFCSGAAAPGCVLVENGPGVADGEGQAAVEAFFASLDKFDFWFEIVGPDPVRRSR